MTSANEMDYMPTDEDIIREKNQAEILEKALMKSSLLKPF